jgi:hypothetical protein
MQKLLLGGLGLLVLYLAAANARLHSEGRLLEERLAAAQQKPLRTAAPSAPPELQPAPGTEAPGPAASLPAGRARDRVPTRSGPGEPQARQKGSCPGDLAEAAGRTASAGGESPHLHPQERPGHARPGRRG